MAIPTINFKGFLYDDAGDAISGATINLYAKNSTTTSLASDTTDSNGAWDINYTTAGTAGLDIQISSGDSKRRIKYDDKIHLAELDTALLNIRAVEGGSAIQYYYADEGEDAGDRWRVQVADGGVMTFANDINSQNSYVTHVTITPNSTVASSTFAIAGLATIAGKLTLSDGFAVGSDANGDILYNNGTKYVRLGRGSDGDVLTLASSIPSWATPTTGDITAVVAGDGLSGGSTSGSATLNVDLNGLTAAAVADGDFIPIIDTNDSNGSRKEAVHDLATLFAGAGMTATSSVLNVIGGDGITANSNDVAITAAQTTVTSVYNASLKMGRDSQNLIDFATTDNKIILRVNNVDEVELVENALSPVTASGVDLGTASLEWGNIYIGDDKKIYLGTGSDASIEYDEDGTDQLRIAGNTIFEDQVQLDKDLLLDPTPANTVWSGITAKFTAGEDLEDGECVYLKAADTKMWKAVANTGGTGLVTAEIMCVAMCVADVSADAVGTFLLQGFLRADTNFPTYAVGETLYLPEAEVGGKNVPEGAAPDTDGDFVQVIGWAADANTVYFSPNFTMVEVA